MQRCCIGHNKGMCWWEVNHDASAAIPLDLGRGFKVVVGVLHAMIRDGITLARSLELTAQWDGIVRNGPVHPLTVQNFDLARRGGLPLEVALPRLTGEMLAEVVHREGATAGSLDGWGWREFKALPVSWFDGRARILSKLEDTGVWPEGLLDACVALISKADGDATSLGQRPLSVLPIACRIWASVRTGDSVFSAGGGRSSVEAWCSTALDIEDVLSGDADSDVHLFVADVIKSFDTVDRVFWKRC